MHADEFEISLSRELNVCKNTIKRIKDSLGILERKHHKSTEAFIAELHAGTLPENADMKDDYTAWQSSYDSLKQWKEMEKQYQEAFKTMRI